MKDTLATNGLLRRRWAGATLLLLAGCGGGNTEKDEDAVAPTLTISSNVAEKMSESLLSFMDGRSAGSRGKSFQM